MSAGKPLLELEHLSKRFPARGSAAGRAKAFVEAVDDVTLSVGQGETLGIVGESGCGKSTLARLAVRLLEPTAGTVRFDGEDITRWPERRLRPLRRQMQIVFQDPYGSLNPRKSVGQIVGEPFAIHRTEHDAKARVRELLDRVGLSPEHHNRYPHEFSGGQRQRIGIARALALEPRLVVCDEPVSALDVSVQAQILNLLRSLQQELGLTYVFISHDLAVIRQVADRVAVMYMGRIVELCDADRLFRRPLHPYTAALLSSVPQRVPGEGRSRRRPVPADAAEGPASPSGCAFHPRCPRSEAGRCDVEIPPLRPVSEGRLAACHHPLEGWPLSDEELRHPQAPAASTA